MKNDILQEQKLLFAISKLKTRNSELEKSLTELKKELKILNETPGNFYKNILENIHDGLYFVDTNRVVTYWNKAAEKISGFTADEVVGKSCADNILTHVDCDGNILCNRTCPLSASIDDGKYRAIEIYIHHKDGHRIPVSVRVSTLNDSNGKVIRGIELFTDISSQSANILRIKELEKLALLDKLTQLANRYYIEKEIQNRFEERDRLDVPFGILFIDIDHFKKINDMYGHSIGDNILNFIAKTFVRNARPFDLYGRWGGEEFIGIIRNVNKEELEVLGNRVRLLVESSYMLHDSKKICVTISIGATVATKTDNMGSIIKRADKLLYKSKVSGRNRLTLA